MKKIASILALALAFSTLTGCNRGFDESFLLEPPASLEAGRSKVFTYDAATCQMSFNRQARTFRAFTDTQSDYFDVVLDELPSREGEHITGTVRYTTETDLVTKKNLNLKVMQLDSKGCAWLWAQKERICVCVRLL